MTPNFGQGANSAIESAAALANTLHDMIHTGGLHKPSDTEIDALLTSFSNPRRKRTKSMLKTARFLTRLQARDGLLNILIGRYIAPYAGDLPASMAGKVMVGAEKLNYLPVPKRSEKGWPESSRAQVWRLRACQGLGVLIVAAGSSWLYSAAVPIVSVR